MRLTNAKSMLETESLKRTVEFYTELLGFTCQEYFPDAEQPVWASLARDDVELMFTARNEHSPIPQPTMTGSLYLNTDNVDEAWAHLKDKVTIEYPIDDFPYGMREFAIRDCNGYLVQFGQEITVG